MKGRLSLLGVLLVALFAILLMKSDRARQIPTNGFADSVDEAPKRVAPRDERAKRPQEVRRKQRKAPRSPRVEETQIPAPSTGETTAPARMKIEVPPGTTSPTAKAARSEDRLPYPWVDQVQEPQPGFVDPNRMDSRSPSGDSILQRPSPTGPAAGFYDPNDRFAEPD